MSYQKFYTNPIQSSSLLCQLASMWKNDIMCDAVIKTGNVNTKAHRVVMMAACPMLQSMDHAASGSKLEIRLSPDIKQQSIQSFLQYLYEGFMMVTEDNYKDIEKIGRLLQVDSVIKCCADFCKSLAVGRRSLSNADQYRYTFCDMIEFRHVRSSDLQRTISENQVKRSHDVHGHCLDNGVKRTRHSSSPIKSSNRNLPNQADNVLDGKILQDSLEFVQVEPADSGGSHQSVRVGVVSHCENNPETSVVIPTGDCCDTPCGSTVVSESPGSPTCTNTLSRNQTPSSSDTSGQRQSPHQSSESMDEISKEFKQNRPNETAPDLAKSCDPKESTEAQGNRLQNDSQLGPDLSIVKVESIAPDPDRHRILEQEQVAADYKDNSSQHRSRPSESKQQTRVHTVSSPPYPFSVSSTMHHLPPVSALSHFMLPPRTHLQVAAKPPPTGLIDLSEDSSGETRRSGDSQPSAIHKLMYIPNRKPCTWCQIKGVKTKSGWYCYASYKCEVCDVPLCKQGRDEDPRYGFVSGSSSHGLAWTDPCHQARESEVIATRPSSDR
uniref:Ring canal kelch-like protein n=1 Tax=Magallana gigas TaxID=29159 RepID=K1QZJ8_MAGGI